MQRYEPPRNNDWKPESMRVDVSGRYVLYSEARAEIDRLEKEVTQLQAEAYKANRRAELANEWRDHDKERADKAEKEVERLRRDNGVLHDAIEKIFEEGAKQLDRADTAWNDAIEVAAKECGYHLSTESDVFLANDIASRIRALKRRQP